MIVSIGGRRDALTKDSGKSHEEILASGRRRYYDRF